MEGLPTRTLSNHSLLLAMDEFALITQNLSLAKNAIEGSNAIKEPDTIMKSVSEAILGYVGHKDEFNNEQSEREPNSEDQLVFADTEDVIKNGRSESLLEQIDGDHPSAENLIKIIDLDERQSKKPKFVNEKKSLTGAFSDIDRQDICRNKTCLDTKFRLPPIYRSSSQNLAWDIKGLGVSQEGSGKKPFLSIKKVNAKRKERHEYTIKEIELRMNDLNEIIEQKIRREAENLVSFIRMIKENVEKIITTLKEKPSSNSKGKLIERIQEIIKQLNDTRLEKIDCYCVFLKKLERERSEEFKIILKNAYRDMHDNMYLMPFEIQLFFEKKVQYLNEVTMNNYHCYAELRRKLKAQMDEEVRFWFQALKYHETIPKTVEESTECFQEVLEEKSSERFRGPTKQDILNQLKKAEDNFVHLRTISKNSKFLQCEATIELFENYLAGMNKAADVIFQEGLVDNNGIKLDSEEIRNIAKVNNVDEEELENLWYQDVEKMLDILDSNLKNFSKSTRLFDHYFNRSEDMNALYEQKLFLLITKHNKQVAPSNVHLNLLIDTLRQDVTEDSLNATMKLIKDVIKSIDDTIQENLQEEIALVDKFCQIGLSNVDILLEELRRFVEHFLPDPESDPRKIRKRASWTNMDEMSTKDHLFPMHFWQCRFLIQSINNWQFGVWNAFSVSINCCKEIIASILDEWADTEKAKLIRGSILKSTISNVRIHFIREDIWKVRFAELKIHEETFVQHDLAVRKLLSQSNKLKAEMIEQCQKIVKTECDTKLNEIMNEFRSVKNEKEATKIINKLKSTNSEILANIDDVHEKFKNDYYDIAHKINVSHIEFMKSIKLFSEDGNFKSVEAKALMKKITALEKLISKEFSNSVKKLDDIRRNLEDKCETQFDAPLFDSYKVMKEFSFKEEIDTKIRVLNREMRESIFDFIYAMRKLVCKMKSWYEASYKKENLGNYEFLQTFTRCFKEILSEICDMGGNIQYNDDLAPNVNILKQRVSQVSLASSTGSKRKNAASRSPSEGSVMSIKRLRRPAKTKSHASMLYQVLPGDDGKLFSGLHHKAHISFCRVRDSARIFYQIHGNILYSDVLPPDYKNFIDNILGKYKHYKLHIEFAWVEVAIEFFEMLENFLKFTRNYHRDSLRKFSENRLESLTEECKKVMDALGGDLKAVENNYSAIHDKLKTMFGHPDNARFIDAIKTYIDEAKGFNQKTFMDHLGLNKDFIEQHCIATETFFLDMEKILSCVRNDTTASTLHKEMKDKLTERIEAIEKILSPDICDLDESNQTSFDIDLRKRLQGCKSRMSVLSDSAIAFTKISQNTISLESSPSMDTEATIDDNFKLYEKTVEKIDSLSAKCSETQDRFEKMWTQEIERISNLYKIKYDTPVPD